MTDRLDALLREGVAAGAAPGVATVVTTRDRVVHEGACGVRVVSEPAPMTADTVVWLASMTKAIVGAAAMQLVERGALSLDAPAGERVPHLAAAQVLEGWTAAGEPVLRAPRVPMTLRHLLTHTAGYGYETWNEDIRRYQQVTGLPPGGSGRRVALTAPLLFDPGTRWNYGIHLEQVGQLIEAASGLRLGEYLQRELFAPLGMVDTAFRIRPDMRARLAKVHQRGADGSLAPTAFELPQDAEFDIGGGGLYGTARDYGRFLRMLLNAGRTDDGRALLAPETVALMATDQLGGLSVQPMRSVIPHRSNDVDFLPGMRKGWGLSFMINDAPTPAGRSAGSLAWAGLANCHFWIDRRRGVAGAILMQVLPFADARATALFEAYERAVHDQFP